MKKSVRRSVFIAAVLMGLMLMGTSMTDVGAVYAKAKSPGKVTSMSLTVTGQPLAKLKWKQATGKANGYTIMRNGKKLVRVNGKDVLSYVDESLKPGKTYTYKVVPHYKNKKGKLTYGKASPVRKVLKGYTYKKASDKTMTLTGYTGRSETVKTPAKIGKVKVKRIGDSCFRGNVWIKKVVVSSGVTEIGKYAFEACGQVKSFTLPGSVRTIGDGAFSGCAQMRYIDIPDGVTSIGKGAFLYCSHLSYMDLPKNLKTMGEFAFAGCERMGYVTFNGDKLTSIPDRAFCQCKKLDEVEIPPCVTSIGKRAFFECMSMGEIKIQGDTTIGDYAFERCFNLVIGVPDPEKKTVFGFGMFSSLHDTGKPFGQGSPRLLPDNSEFADGTFYGSSINGLGSAGAMDGNGFKNYTMKEGVLYSKDEKTLIAYFPTMMKDMKFQNTEAAETGVFTVPDGVKTIAPYAFYNSKLTAINLPESLERIDHNAFTMSDVKQEMLTGGEGADIDEKAFENCEIPQGDPADEINYDDIDDLDPNQEYEESTTYTYESLAGDGIFDADKFKGYLDIHEGFEDWCQKYIEFNKNNVPMTREAMPYITMYTGEDHYRQMTSVLNGDTYKTQQSILRSGDDYKDMYLMIDHGLFAELSRGKMPGDLLLYSGITPERVFDLAGEKGTQGAITDELKGKIIGRIGQDYSDPAIMSTSANLRAAFTFSGGDYGSQTLIMIYAPRKALDQLGTICVDGFSLFSGEEEVLFNAGAKYKILDVGKVTRTEVNLDPVTSRPVGAEEVTERTYVKLQLLGTK